MSKAESYYHSNRLALDTCIAKPDDSSFVCHINHNLTLLTITAPSAVT